MALLPTAGVSTAAGVLYDPPRHIADVFQLPRPAKKGVGAPVTADPYVVRMLTGGTCRGVWVGPVRGVAVQGEGGALLLPASPGLCAAVHWRMICCWSPTHYLLPHHASTSPTPNPSARQQQPRPLPPLGGAAGAAGAVPGLHGAHAVAAGPGGPCPGQRPACPGHSHAEPGAGASGGCGRRQQGGGIWERQWVALWVAQPITSLSMHVLRSLLAGKQAGCEAALWHLDCQQQHAATYGPHPKGALLCWVQHNPQHSCPASPDASLLLHVGFAQRRRLPTRC
jgi:hypothetical protein